LPHKITLKLVIEKTFDLLRISEEGGWGFKGRKRGVTPRGEGDIPLSSQGWFFTAGQNVPLKAD